MIIRLITLLLLPSAVIGRDVFREDVQPVLQTHCFKCHGQKKQKGVLRLDQLDPDMVNGNAAETWHDALNMLNRGEMPPEEETPIPESKKKLILAELKALLKISILETKSFVRTPIRRMR